MTRSYLGVRFLVVCAVCVGMLSPTLAMAQAKSLLDRIEKFVTPSTFAVARIRLDKVDLEVWRQRLGDRSSDARTAISRIPTLQLLSELKRHGAKEAFLFFKISTYEREVDHMAVWFANAPDRIDELQTALRPFTAFDNYHQDGQLILITRGDSQPSVDEARVARTQMVKALEQHPNSMAVFAIALSKAQRDALRLVEPAMPIEFGERPVADLAEDLDWLSVGLRLEPRVDATVTVQATSSGAAERLRDWIRSVSERAKSAPSGPAAGIIASLAIASDGDDRIVLRCEQGSRDGDHVSWLGRQLADIVFPLLVDESIAKARALSLNLINFESAYGHYPAAATYDANDRPLLSWRVHLLPFMNEQELYQRFNLDEPWDSPHNRELIKEMPTVYLSTASKLDPKDGKSNFVAPVGDRYLIGLKTPHRVRNVRDGTSRTICLLEVDDAAAEVWTKPVTSATDVADLSKHLQQLHQNRFVVSLGDGRTLTLRSDIPSESLQRLLQIDNNSHDQTTNEYELLKQYQAR